MVAALLGLYALRQPGMVALVAVLLTAAAVAMACDDII